MRKIPPALLLAGAVLATVSCGHKGAIMAPLTRTPKPVGALTLGQKGGRVFVKWTATGAYLDGRPLPAAAGYEIWLLRNDAKEAALDRSAAVDRLWARAFRLAVIDIQGRPIDEKTAAPASGPKTEFLWEWTMSPEDWKATRLIVGVRVSAGKRDFSDFSYMGWWPRKMPTAPGKPRATVFPDRIEIRWTAPTLNVDGTKPPVVKGYNVYRSSPGETPVRINTAPVAVSYFMDREFLFAKPYAYAIRALTGDRAPYVESDDSEVLEITPADVFPPGPPKNLTSVTTVGMITLIWEAGPGPGTTGFRIWRKADDETEFKPLTPQAIAENTFTDKTIESGHRYAYVVTAVDAAGNESARSETLTEIIKDAGR